MLIEFRTENHRSIRDEQVLTMEAGRVGDENDPRIRHVKGHKQPLLTVAAIYGANASGKSNFLSAIEFMKTAVIDSHRLWRPDGGIPRKPFGWGKSKNDTSLFEVTLLLDGVRYEFGFVVDDEKVLEEWLYAWPLGKKQVWYERDLQKMTFGEKLKGKNQVIADLMRPNSLFLSTSVQFENAMTLKIYQWFTFLEVTEVSPYGFMHWLIEDDDTEVKHVRDFINITKKTRKEYLMFLKLADLGITDFKMEFNKEGNRDIRFKHKSSKENSWLSLDEESEGTKRLFYLTLPLLFSMQYGHCLVIDELEASLHPSLASMIVNLFNNPDINVNNAQLIFTTHDTNLLGNIEGVPVLRRDQVWLTEKDDEGGTELYPLTDYKPRKNENLERGYLQGRYGAIPFLGNIRDWAEGVSHVQAT